MEDPSTTVLLLLALAGLTAGFVDAVVGGGGLIQLPALLLGLPQAAPVQVLATNKLASICGTTVSSATYFRRVRPDPRTFLPLMAVELYDGHVTTDVFFQRFPLAVQKACILIGAALTLLLYLTLAWFSLDAALAATATGEVVMGAWSLPIWIVRWVLPIAFVTAAMGALASLVMQLRGTAGKGEPVPHE